MSKSPIRVAVTGAAGQLGYSLLFRIASGEMSARSGLIKPDEIGLLGQAIDRMADDLAAGRLLAPWGFVETPARLALWQPLRNRDQRAAQLARWLVAELGDLAEAPAVD